MTPERWQQIDALYHAVLERTPEERALLLSGVNPDLWGEVESLLAQNGTFLDHAAADLLRVITATRVTAGTQLGPYKVESSLGQGGMGQVFSAIDTRLGRKVAIKVSSEQFTERFEREARAISSLNHPYICTLYDVGPNYLVMELVEGETLAARIRKGKLSFEDAVRYGAQIMDAIAAAHAYGIVHRDLKPDNVMLNKSGVKVLDFGIARSIHDETLTANRMAVGTPAYMAPEQREGKECDARADIYSFGLMLCEMITGQRPKEGQPPALTGASNQLQAIVEGCLEADPEKRWHSAFDVKKQLLGAAAAVRPNPSDARSTRLSWAIAGMAVAGMIFAVIVLLRPKTSARQLSSEFTVSLEEVSTGRVPVPSPDGRLLVFAGQARGGAPALWLRPLESLEARPLAGTEGTDGAIVWSPDGKWIAFHAAGKLKQVSPWGGPPQTIADLPDFQDAAWGAHGDIVFRPRNREPLFRIRASGGAVQPLTTLNRSLQENSHRYPQFLEDGRHFLFVSRSANRTNNALYESSLDSRELKRIMPVEAQVFYVPRAEQRPGNIVFYRDGGLWAQEFDSGSGKLSSPVLLYDKVAYNAPSVYASFQVSRDGRVIVAGGDNPSRLVWFRRDGEELSSVATADDLIQVRLSPDETRVAYSRPDPQTGSRDIWLTELSRGISSRLITNIANDWFPVWAPDSRRLLFGSDRQGGTAMKAFLKTSLDVGSDEEAMREIEQPYDWSRDGKWISYGSSDIDIAPAAGSVSGFNFLKTSAWAVNGRFSPDTKWIAYSSDDSGRFEIYVRPFSGGPAGLSGKVQVSINGGEFPVWGPGGKELYFMSADSRIYAADTRKIGGSDTVPAPSPLFRACPNSVPTSTPGSGVPYSYVFDTLDGQRFLVSCRAQKPGRFAVLTNREAGM